MIIIVLFGASVSSRNCIKSSFATNTGDISLSVAVSYPCMQEQSPESASIGEA